VSTKAGQVQSWLLTKVNIRRAVVNAKSNSSFSPRVKIPKFLVEVVVASGTNTLTLLSWLDPLGHKQ
jgi:hypothetical protein